MGMMEEKTTDFLDELSSKASVPGGGGASAAVGAYAAALGEMVANLTVGKKKYADVEEEIQAARVRLEELRADLVQLVDADAEAFAPLSKAYSLPKDTPEEQAEKDRVLEEALYTASLTPLSTMETILETMRCLQVVAEKGSKLAVSDAGVGILFAQAALEGASLNVFINTDMMKDKERAKEMNVRAEQMITEGRTLKEKVYATVLTRIGRPVPENGEKG